MPRITHIETLCQEINAWKEQCHQQKAKIDWRFAAEDARVKLLQLYPDLHLS